MILARLAALLLILAVLSPLIMLGGCVKVERDPLSVYEGGAYEIPVTTFAVVPF